MHSFVRFKTICKFDITQDSKYFYQIQVSFWVNEKLAIINQCARDKKFLDQRLFCKKLLIQLDKEIHESNSVSIFQSGYKLFL